MMKLGISRTREQLQVLRERAKERGIEIIPLPLTSVEPIEFDWPDSLVSEKVDWLVFTSASGARSYFARTAKLGIGLSHSSRLAAVGNKTAQAIHEFTDREIDLIPEEGYGEILFRELIDQANLKGKQVVYARAEQVSFDPADLFREAGVDYLPIICYRTLSQLVDPEIVARLSSEDCVLFTAPSAVRSYADQFGQPVARQIAIGRTTAAMMNALGWIGFGTLKTRDIDTVLEYI